MSKIKLTGHASGSGVLTIAAPNTDSDRTITLPDVTGTLLDSGSDLPAANLTGTVADARISALTASKLTGALPAISGANLTGLSATDSTKLPLAGGSMTGDILPGTNSIHFADNGKLKLGGGEDLTLYHNGTQSYIENTLGNLLIKTDSGTINLQKGSSEYLARFHTDGAAELYHNNQKKLETTANGITLQNTNGTLLVTQLNKTIDTYGSNSNWQRMMFAGGTGTQYYHSFRLSNNTQVGYINTDGSSTSYNTSSDYRLKENVDYTWDATTRLKQLKPARFNWIADETNTVVDGFIAHEVEDIVPEAISGEKDAMEAAVLYKEGDELPEGKSVGDVKFAEQISPQSIDQAKLVPLLVKTIQELEARITAGGL